MGQNTTVLGIVAVVIIIVVLVSPTLIVAGQNLLNDFFEGWQSFWSNISGSGGTGNANIGATIHYEDGTSDTIKANKGVPLTVTYGDNPKPLLSIDFSLFGVFTYQGTLESLYVDATIEFDFNKDGTPEKTNSKTGYDSSVPSSGASNPLTFLSVSSGELESYATESKEYSTQVRGRATLTLTFTDGTVQELETPQDVTGTFTFNIQVAGATSLLSGYVGADPWYEPPEWK